MFATMSNITEQNQSLVWIWFWNMMEIFTAYVIACIVSFRMLFVRNDKTTEANKRKEQRHLPRSKEQPRRQRFLNSLFDTFHEWEGTETGGEGGFLNRPVPSGLMSVDFMRDEIWMDRRNDSSAISGGPQQSADGDAVQPSGRNIP